MRGMMKGRGRHSGLWTMFVVVFGCGHSAGAAPVKCTITYSTSMDIGSRGVTGPSVVGFQGIEGGKVDTPTPFQYGNFVDPLPQGYGSNLPLGSFVVSPPAVGTTTTYQDTPFSLTFKVDSANGDGAGVSPKSFVVQGFLNGSVSGTEPSTLQANLLVALSPSPRFFPDHQAGGFDLGQLSNVLTIPDFHVPLNPDSPTGSVVPLTGVLVSAAPVPEPGSLTVLTFLGLTALGWNRRRKRTVAIRASVPH